MKEMNRTITRGLSTFLIVAAFALALAPGASAQAQVIQGVQSATLPYETHAASVAIGPDGTAWFGTVDSFAAALFDFVPGAAEPSVDSLPFPKDISKASSLAWGPEGDLWFLLLGRARTAIGRLDATGGLTEYELPGAEDGTYGPDSLTIGPEGDPWFTRAELGKVGTVTPTGAVTEFDVGPKSHPAGIATGSDGAIWFAEQQAGKIGRITPAGDLRLIRLGRKVYPRQIVAGADGALWFSEIGRRGRGHKVHDRIGRITTSGEVAQFPIPFGSDTQAIAADPRGVIWFSTARNELSSISMSGTIGARGCLEGSCETPVESLAVASDGSLFFAAGAPQCRVCGGGTQLLTDQQGTSVGRIPPNALAPATDLAPPAAARLATSRRLPAATGRADQKPPHVTVKTLPAYGVNEYGTLLNSRINPHGRTATYRFQWGRTKRYGHIAPEYSPEEPVYPGYEGYEIEEVIEDLSPGTWYHFRAVAYSHGHKFFGQDRKFRTWRYHPEPPG